MRMVAADDVTNLRRFPGNVHAVDRHGLNALMVAAKLRCFNVLQYCIVEGVGRSSIDKDERREGLCALHMAAMRWAPPPQLIHGGGGDLPDSWRCVDLLLRSGACLTKVDALGRTVLHHAVSGRLVSIVEYLCRLRGAHELLVASDSEGATPLQRALGSRPRPSLRLPAPPGEDHSSVHSHREAVLPDAAPDTGIVAALEVRARGHWFVQRSPFGSSTPSSPPPVRRLCGACGLRAAL